MVDKPLWRDLKVRVLLWVCVCPVLVLAQNAVSSDVVIDANGVEIVSTEQSVLHGTDLRTPIPDDADRPSVMQRSIIIVDDAQRLASERFISFMTQVDGFFSNSDSDDDLISNESWGRIRFDLRKEEDGGVSFDPSLKIRAVLPQTQRRFKLLFSTEEDDQDDGDQSVSGDTRRRNASLALRFVRTARERANIDADLGVRQRDGGIQYFSRLSLRVNFNLGAYWFNRVDNKYYYYSRSGFENRFSFSARRQLLGQDNLFFRTATSFHWEKGQKGAVIAHTSGIYWWRDKQRSLAFEALTSYHTALNSGIDDRHRGYELRFRWRHNVWREWFFYEVWPSLLWPSFNGYERTNALLLRAEIIFGKR